MSEEKLGDHHCTVSLYLVSSEVEVLEACALAEGLS